MATHAADVIYDCLVLGAGIAGVTAARNLQAKGLSVLLLEGADRIGGRIYSKRDFVKNPNYVPNPAEEGKYIPIEAGAEYVHVEKKDRYRAFWDELSRQRFSTSKFHKTGSLIPPDEPRARTFFPAWKRTLTALESLSVHGAYISGVRVAEDVEHYLTVARGQVNQFSMYYRNKYPPKTHTALFWDKLLSEVVFGGRPEEEIEEEDARDSHA